MPDFGKRREIFPKSQEILIKTETADSAYQRTLQLRFKYPVKRKIL